MIMFGEPFLKKLWLTLNQKNKNTYINNYNTLIITAILY